VSQVLSMNSSTEKNPLISLETTNCYGTASPCAESTIMQHTTTSTLIAHMDSPTSSFKFTFNGNSSQNFYRFDKDNSHLNTIISSSKRHSPSQTINPSPLSTPLDALALACASQETVTVLHTNSGTVSRENPNTFPLMTSRFLPNTGMNASNSGNLSKGPQLFVNHTSSTKFPSNTHTISSITTALTTAGNGTVSQCPTLINTPQFLLVPRSHSQTEELNTAIPSPPSPTAITSLQLASETVSSSTDFHVLPHTTSCQISVNDVLCGRGGLTNHHPGNVFFRKMVRHRQEAYLRASKRDKASVARHIVDTIRKLSPPGRFLKKGPDKTDMWTEIGDRKAREKTSQALRENAPELREELQNGINIFPERYEQDIISDHNNAPNSTTSTHNCIHDPKLSDFHRISLPNELHWQVYAQTSNQFSHDYAKPHVSLEHGVSHMTHHTKRQKVSLYSLRAKSVCAIQENSNKSCLPLLSSAMSHVPLKQNESTVVDSNPPESKRLDGTPNRGPCIEALKY